MAVTGAILGDIAGSQYEHRRPRDLDYKNCEIFTKDCHYTDDTVMTLAVKKALQHSLDIAETLQELGRFLIIPSPMGATETAPPCGLPL